VSSNLTLNKILYEIIFQTNFAFVEKIFLEGEFLWKCLLGPRFFRFEL
jgi:hypothetical protein